MCPDNLYRKTALQRPTLRICAAGHCGGHLTDIQLFVLKKFQDSPAKCEVADRFRGEVGKSTTCCLTMGYGLDIVLSVKPRCGILEKLSLTSWSGALCIISKNSLRDVSLSCADT